MRDRPTREPATLGDQLQALRNTRFAQVPRSRFVMQVFLPSAQHSASNRQDARTRVLDWAARKWAGCIPRTAYDGMAFEHDQAGLRIAATSNADGSLWAFRSEHLDGESTCSRTWVTEAVVADLDTADAFGVRNSCSTLRNEPIPATSPRFLRDFVSMLALADAGQPVRATPLHVRDQHAFNAFSNLLLSRERSLPIVAVSTLPQSENLYAIDVERLARDVQGLAHIVCLPTAMTYMLSDAVTKSLSVYQGAVRTYMPGFSTNDDPWGHYLVLPQRISEWSDAFGAGPEAYRQFLTHQLHALSVDCPRKLEQLPSYFTIRRAVLEKPNKTLEEEIQLLRIELEDARAREKYWEDIASDRDTEAIANEDENRRLRAQNQTLTADLRELRSARGSMPIEIPNDYEALPRWVDSCYADRLYLHPRAVRALKDAQFENVRLVYHALQLLAETYWTMKVNSDPAQRPQLMAAWEEGLRSLHLEYNSHAVAPNRLGEFRDQYTIPYRIGQSSCQVLGPHLKYGTSRDERFCLRIYFLWDDERQLVVVGHLPSHLETRAT